VNRRKRKENGGKGRKKRTVTGRLNYKSPRTGPGGGIPTDQVKIFQSAEAETYLLLFSFYF
jgi:hypothetical protein